jgi:uncharacterized protein YacL
MAGKSKRKNKNNIKAFRTLLVLAIVLILAYSAYTDFVVKGLSWEDAAENLITRGIGLVLVLIVERILEAVLSITGLPALVQIVILVVACIAAYRAYDAYLLAQIDVYVENAKDKLQQLSW